MADSFFSSILATSHPALHARKPKEADLHWFESLDDARERIEEWRHIYNHVRPHGSLGRIPPAEFARAFYENLEAQAAA